MSLPPVLPKIVALIDQARRVDMQGMQLFVASVAEDVVIAKLEWAKPSASRRQIEDAAGILKIAEDSLDRSYLDPWVLKLELAKEWDDAQRIIST